MILTTRAITTEYLEAELSYSSLKLNLFGGDLLREKKKPKL